MGNRRKRKCSGGPFFSSPGSYRRAGLNNRVLSRPLGANLAAETPPENGFSVNTVGVRILERRPEGTHGASVHRKVRNRPIGPTILLFLCFEQLTAEPILLFRTPHERLVLIRSLGGKPIGECLGDLASTDATVSCRGASLSHAPASTTLAWVQPSLDQRSQPS